MDHKCEDLIRHLVIPLHLDGCLGFIVIIASFLTDLLVHDSFVLPTHPTILPIPVACYPVAPFFISPPITLVTGFFFFCASAVLQLEAGHLHVGHFSCICNVC
jgi:hypothetical protein